MYENYKAEIERETKKFRKGVDAIRNSENPYYADKAVQDFEIRQKREELEKNVKEINDKFNAEIEKAIAQAEPVAAKSYFKPSETDKRLVSEYVTDFLADAKLGYTEKDKLDAFDRFEQKLGYLDENGLHEVRKHLPELADKLGNDEMLQKKLRGMNATFKQLQTAEQLQLDELKEAKSNGIDSTYRRLRITSPIYSDYKLNRYHK